MPMAVGDGSKTVTALDTFRRTARKLRGLQTHGICHACGGLTGGCHGDPSFLLALGGVSLRPGGAGGARDPFRPGPLFCRGCGRVVAVAING